MPDAACAALSQLQDRLPTGRPVPEENLHLTLAFLGDQTAEAAHDLHEALDTLRAPAPHLTLSGAEMFGGRRGQAIALGADGGPLLTGLHDRIRARLHSARIGAERRRFRPHVTITRLSDAAQASACLPALIHAQLGPYRCDAFGLYASTLHSDGAIHDELARYPLA